jgi:membrane-associated protease RseP (regulator of RpoE activity)
VTDTSARPAEAPAPAPEGEIAGFDWRLALLLTGTVALGVFGGWGWLTMVLAIVVMIFLHELGHYLTAKWSGMKVTEFFLFFGPKIWSFKRGETEYGIKCIPLGAYVRIIGMSNLETDVPPEDEPRTYRQQSFPKRLLVVSAGSIMHMLQAFVLFFFAFSIIGVPGNSGWAQDLGAPEPAPDTWTVGLVVEGTPAADAGIQSGDEILSIDGQSTAVFDELGTTVSERPGEDVEIVFVHDGERRSVDVTLGERAGRQRDGEDPDLQYGYLGITEDYPEGAAYRVNPVRGVSESAQATGSVLTQTFTGFASFFGGGVDDFAANVADGSNDGDPPATAGSPQTISEEDAKRPLSIFGIARLGANVFEEGVVNGLILMAVVNVSIGLLNMIPLLPLDGGHVAIATYERLRSTRKRRYMADISRLVPITYAVFMFMVLLGMSSIYLDIVDPIG